MQLIQIVPRLPPSFDGIGDYALQIAGPLLAEQGIQTLFLVGDPDWNGPEQVDGYRTIKVRERTEKGLRAAITDLEADVGPVPMLVHFAVYGYEKRGCPTWLTRGLEALHHTRPTGIHVAFHELENRTWKPWSSVFWATGLQKQLIERVARVSTFRYTNTEQFRGKLENWGLGRFDLILNFSNVGEPSIYPTFEERRPEMVIFGRGAQRRWTYERGGSLIGPLCRRLGVERIIDIGQPIEDLAPSYDGVPVVALGRVSDAEVKAQMAAAWCSFMQYPLPLLTKSSVHAVSCAFGTTPFVFDGVSQERSCPHLFTGEDFVPVDCDPGILKLPPLDQLSRRVFDNYQTRSSRKAAAVFGRRLRGLVA